MTTRYWNTRYGDFNTASDWTPSGVPVAGDTAIINAATVSNGSLPSSLNLQINAGLLASSSASLALSSGTVSIGTRITLTATNLGSVTLQATGLVNNGLIKFQEQAGSTAVTHGTLQVANGDARVGPSKNASVIQLSAGYVVIEGGELANYGAINLSTPAQDTPRYSVGDFETTVSGTGVIHVGAATKADFNAPIGSGQTVAFEPGNSLAPVAIVERPETFAATFANFTAASSILLSTPLYDGTQVSASNGTTTLSFIKAGATVSTLKFSGTYTSDQLTLAPVPNGSTLETVTITTTQQTVTDPGMTLNDVPGVPVYRFFDTRLGTHFFTADSNEAGRTLQTRPDLKYEGLGLRAVNPVADDASAVPVYRFFDSVAGTHFFTASESEKATIIATRPDLVFEPSSVFSEHSTAQSGDVAVYRFFDSIHGTHFYTADSAEIAGIASGRPDLIAEGIGFYAPGS